MGYYIQAPSNKGKADFIVNEYGAEIVGTDTEVPEWDKEKAIICVVDNGLFEAAGYAYSPTELTDFALPDRGPQRPRIWLKMDRQKAEELSGFSKLSA